MTFDPSRLTTLIDAPAIATRLTSLAAEIRAAYGDAPITMIVVLKGSFIFAADLARAMADHDVEMDFLGVRSYEGTTSSGSVEITHDLRKSIEGRHCLIVEDIVDTGLTLSFLTRILAERHPASLRIATLLDKPSRREVPLEADFVAFTIEDAFVVGYGLDLDQRYRQLPYVAIYDPS